MTPKLSARFKRKEVAIEVIKANPGWGSRTLAGLIMRQFPGLFSDIEAARRVIRYARGKAGPRDRKYAVEIPGDENKRTIWPLPKSDVDDWDKWGPVPVPDFKCAAIIADVHLPFHDDAALGIALDYFDAQKPDTVILLGDLMDYYRLSFWEQDPRKRNLNHEVQVGRSFLEHLRDRFPKASIIYKEGNHEERLTRHVWSRCPEFAQLMDQNGEEVINTKSVLDLKSYDVQWVGMKKPILLGDHIYLLHGHEFRAPMTNPVNPARGLFLRTKANAMCGDLHQTSSHTEAGLHNVISTWSVGCLCKLHAAYMPLNKWNHGFAVVRMDARRAWSVDNKKIIKGCVV